MAEMQDRYIPARTIDRPFTENEDGSLDVKILILSGEEMYRDAEGDFVIDLAAVSLHKTTLIMDYNHNESEVIGHITNLRYEDGGLWGDAHLFSARSGDRAEEVILRIAGGTPYEISPTVSFGDSDVLELAEGETETVNQRNVEGPALIFRNTPVRGVSICPYGTDKYTGITTLKMEKKGDLSMADKNKKSQEPQAAHPDLEAMISEFGETDGLKYFRAGKSLDEARAEDYANLKAERAARLAAETAKLSEGDGGDGDGGGEGGDDSNPTTPIEGDTQTEGNPGSEEGSGDGEGNGEPGGSGPASTEGGGDSGGPASTEGGGGDEGEEPTSGGKKKKRRPGEEGDEEDGQLHAKLSAELSALRAEVETLKATLRKGEDEPVTPNRFPAPTRTETEPDPRGAVFRMAEKIKRDGFRN